MSNKKHSEFHPLSEQYMHETDLSHRKSHGQYFTPRSIRERLLAYLPDQHNPSVLDPACGTGEFLLSASEKWKNANLSGWEIDKTLIKIAQKINRSAEILETDALSMQTDKKFDFIVGNPPYFELKLSEPQKRQFKEILGGRMNIFSLFIKLSLDLLKDNGYLGFVVPPSMNNGAFFSKLREYIINNADITNLEIISSPALFSNAQQQVMILILKKQKNSEKYVFKKNGISIFTQNKTKLQKAFSQRSTLYEQNFSVKTGSIVWNQNREKLTNNQTNSILLIWSHNIGDQKLILENSSKPQYIHSTDFETGPAIVVNRVTGTASQSKIRAVVISKSIKFLAENHVNVIKPPDEIDGKKVSIALLKSLAKQISSDENCHIIRLITGNTQLSKTELWKLIPLDFKV